MRLYKKTLLFSCLGFALIALIVSYAAPRIIEHKDHYDEAEPLVQLVWPLAGESAKFTHLHGRRPNGLEEVDQFSESYDFSPLQKYRPQFHPSGEMYFQMRVNDSYTLIIDQNFAPRWARTGETETE